MYQSGRTGKNGDRELVEAGMSESEEIEIEEAEVEEGGGWSLPTFCILVLGGVVAFLMYATNETVMWTDANPSKAHSDTKAIYSAAQQYLMTHRRIPTIEELTTPTQRAAPTWRV